MGTRKATLTILLVLTLVLVSFPQFKVGAQPKTIFVPDEFLTIQDAIDSANEFDTIFVKSGLYYQTAIINKSLSLVGENKETTIIDGNSSTTRIYVESNNVTITGFTVRNVMVTTEEGILLLRVNYCNITENNFINNRRGIDLIDSSYNVIANNMFTDGGLSISGFNNSIYENEIVNCNTGIGISYGSDNNISRNNLINNSANGFNFYDTKNNYIIANNVTNSGKYGIQFTASNGNVFLRNNFKNNNQTFDSAIILTYIGLSINIWDDEFQGNYWSDYNGTDNNGDGIGDTTYIINENNQDNYPLMEPVEIPEFPSCTILVAGLSIVLMLSIIYRNRFSGRKNEDK